MKNGLLIINLGTTDKAEVPAVRRYLAEFLTDKRVIDLPTPLRYLLVYGLILPFRVFKTTRAYQAIWTKEGAPLLSHSLNLQKKLQEKLAADWQVELGMRYGQPSIAQALEKLKACQTLTILPLYPQYSSAATGSSLEKVLQLLAAKNSIPSLKIKRDFYQDPGFIKAQAALIKLHLKPQSHLLLSYHGLPEHHLHASGCKLICKQACPPINESNEACYKAQSYATSRALAAELSLTEQEYSVAFQSRLGRTPWIKPYTDELLPLLIQQGVKQLVVACPSFVADCLETLEEIGLRAKKQWQQLGGEELILVPCVNDSDLWVEALIQIITI